MDAAAKSLSLPFMDLDELPVGLADVDDMYLGTYLNGVKADATVKTDFLPSIDLPDDVWGDIPFPGAGQHAAAGGAAPSADPLLGVDVSGGAAAAAAAPQPGMHVAGAAPPHGAHLNGAAALSDPGPGLASTSGNSRSSSDHPKALLTMDSGRTHQGSSGEPERLSDEEAGPAPAQKLAASKSRGGRARKITPQRQQNNRKAQQRYREKRKQQAADLDAKVALLTAELESLRGLQGRAEELQAENERLRQQLQLGRAGSGASPAASREPSGQPDVLEEPRPSDSLAPAQYDGLREQLQATAAQMAALLQRAGLPTDSAKHDAEMPAGAAAELAELLAAAESLSLKMMLLAPSCPLDKILSNLAAKGAQHPCEIFRARWTRVLEAMCLTTAQQDALLEARQHALGELRRVYEQRNNLNQIAMSIMLPRQAPASMASPNAPDRVSTDGKIRWAEQYGGCDMLSQSAHLGAALNDLRANLAAERRLLAQMHGLIVKKVLSPTQSAVMFVQTDAHPIEPLHVTNLVACQRGQGLSSGISLNAVPKEQQDVLLTPYGPAVPVARA